MRFITCGGIWMNITDQWRGQDGTAAQRRFCRITPVTLQLPDPLPEQSPYGVRAREG